MNNFKQSTSDHNELFPVPQEMVSLGGEGKLTDHITIVVSAHTQLKAATMPMLCEILTANGFTYTISDSVIPNQSTIFIMEEHQLQGTKSHTIHPEFTSALNRAEGYRLHLTGTPIIDIGIVGCDSDGIHYGVVTLRSIFAQSSNHLIRHCVITDYPNIIYRGYIEGFYGFPWSHEDRIDLMRFGGALKLNTYIYAPKDDPYHRKSWRELYPSDKAREIAELASAGHNNLMNFVWTIHPGDTIDLADEEDYKSAIMKLEQLYDLGVRQFGILFDDLVGVPNGMEQAQFINRIDTEFIKAKGDVRPLITVGTRYCEAWGPSMQQYFKPFVDTLHEDIEIMWTGAATMSNMTREQFEAPQRAIDSEKRLSAWWNYPVNDYCDNKLLMGRIDNLSADLDNINGFFSNPMNQSQASKQALFCIADHNWNTSAFDAEKSFTASFKMLAPEVAMQLQIFASNCCYVKDDGGASGVFVFEESWYVKDDTTQLLNALKLGQDASDCADRLQIHFTDMADAADQIEANCLNVNLVQELKPFLEAFRLMAQAAQQVIYAYQALRSGDITAMEKCNEDAYALFLAMDQCKVLRLKEGSPQEFTVDVGTLVIKPFIQDMIVGSAVAAGTEQPLLIPTYEMNNIALSSLGVTATASQSVDRSADASQVITGSIRGGKWCSTEHRPYLTVDLQRPVTVRQYRVVNCGHPEAAESRMWNTMHLQILASIDGVHFTVVDEVKHNEADVINRMLFDEVEARYVRLQIIEPAQTSMNGGGHTRIYAFELFETGYPDHSDKVLTSDIRIDSRGDVTIREMKRGDVVSLFHTLNDEKPFAAIEVTDEEMSEIVFVGAAREASGDRVFVERTARNYLRSVRTSRTIQELSE